MPHTLKMPRKKALNQLGRLIQDLQEFSTTPTGTFDEITVAENSIQTWLRKANANLSAINDGIQIGAMAIRPISLSWNGELPQPTPLRERVENYRGRIESLNEQLERYLQSVNDPYNFEETKSGKVFVIHGHGNRKPVEHAIEELGLESVVLIEEAGGSKTIIEKLERYTEDVDYAVALFTPDDQGRKNGVRKFHDRARQNVILETGYFLAAKGRDYVCILKSESVSLADISDLQGIITIDYGETTNWKVELRKELEAADVI
jgi:predicted nucleotide-binding protein